MARHALGRRALAGAFGLVLLLYFAAWLAVMLSGLGGGPIDYRMVGGLLLISAGTVLVVGVPVLAGGFWPAAVPRRPSGRGGGCWCSWPCRW
jgi:hypothetical protein